MEKNNFNKAEFLYNIAVSYETPMENSDDISLSIQMMLEEIRELGYEDYHYLSDITLRSIKDPRIMKILFKYYNKMDLFTKDSLMYKIHPKVCPEILSIAKKEFLNLGPSDKMNLNGFQTAMSKGKFNDSYIEEMLELLRIGENYAYLSEVKKKLCKKAPLQMLPLIEKYENGVLILCVIQDCEYLGFSNNIIYKLENWTNITENEIKSLKSHENNQELSVTTYEYYRNLCSVDCIHTNAKNALKKINKSNKQQ